MMDSKPIDLEPAVPVSQGMTLDDVYFIVFRHKWAILLCTLAGFVAAVASYKLNPPPYESEAKLYVRYVTTEAKAQGPIASDVDMKSPDQRGETIMDSEVEILTSLDLSRQVVLALGVDKILGRPQIDERDLDRAATVIKRNLTIEVPPMSSVIRIALRHPNGEVAQQGLRELVDRYLKLHMEIHQTNGKAGDFLSQETDQLRSRLSQTDEELRKAKAKAGVISLDEARRTDSEAEAKIRQDIFATEAELAERTAFLRSVNAKDGREPASPTSAPRGARPTADEADQYRTVKARVDILQQKEQTLLSQFTPENADVKAVESQLAQAKAVKQKLEADFPSLLSNMSEVSGSDQKTETFNPEVESYRLSALQARVRVLNEQLKSIRAEMDNVDQMAGAISELQRRKDIEESNYKYYVASLEQARIDEALGSGHVSNISQIQTPSQPFRDTKKAYKLLGILAVSGVMVGLGGSFAYEILFDRTVKRPIDFERLQTGPGLMLSIPDLGRKAIESVSLVESTGPKAGNNSTGAALRPFLETLSHRIIGNFDARNLTHNPKLIAVTGIGKESGVSTVAAGLAACLSKIGDGKILLVDMNPTKGSAQRFYKGQPLIGLDDIFSQKDKGKIEDNLYVATDEADQDALYNGMSMRLDKLVPKLKAGDFDYIIFDLPAVSQTSMTPHMARYMDLVLLVVKSEMTNRELVSKAASLMKKSHVAAVLNMTHSHVPSRLQNHFFEDT